jgi:hypothetical protein
MILLLFLVLTLCFTPYATEGLNLTQVSSLVVNILTLLVGIMLIITADLESAAKLAGEKYDTRQKDIVSLLIFIANLSVMFVPLINLIVNGNLLGKALACMASMCYNEDERDLKQLISDRRRDASTNNSSDPSWPATAAAPADLLSGSDQPSVDCTLIYCSDDVVPQEVLDCGPEQLLSTGKSGGPPAGQHTSGADSSPAPDGALEICAAVGSQRAWT